MRELSRIFKKKWLSRLCEKAYDSSCTVKINKIFFIPFNIHVEHKYAGLTTSDNFPYTKIGIISAYDFCARIGTIAIKTGA